MNNRSSLVGLAVLLLLAGCSAAEHSGQIDRSDGRIFFLVTDENDEVIQHAKVYLVSNGQTRLFASRTSSSELLSGPLDQLLAAENGAILVCASGYYCGGWLVDDPIIQVRQNLERVNQDIAITLSTIRLR